MGAFKVQVIATGEIAGAQLEGIKAQVSKIIDDVRGWRRDMFPPGTPPDEIAKLEIVDHTTVPKAEWPECLEKVGLPEQIVGCQVSFEVPGEGKYTATVLGCEIWRKYGVVLKVEPMQIGRMSFDELTCRHNGATKHDWILGSSVSDDGDLVPGDANRMYPESVVFSDPPSPEPEKVAIPKSFLKYTETSVMASCGAEGCNGSVVVRLGKKAFTLSSDLNLNAKWVHILSDSGTQAIGLYLMNQDDAPICPECQRQFMGVMIVQTERAGKHFVAVP